MAKRQVGKPQQPQRPPQRPAGDVIDSEQKAREESEAEEGHAQRFWETDEEHQQRIAGERDVEAEDEADDEADEESAEAGEGEDAPADATGQVDEAERHAEEGSTQAWADQSAHHPQQ